MESFLCVFRLIKSHNMIEINEREKMRTPAPIFLSHINELGVNAPFFYFFLN